MSTVVLSVRCRLAPPSFDPPARSPNVPRRPPYTSVAKWPARNVDMREINEAPSSANPRPTTNLWPIFSLLYTPLPSPPHFFSFRVTTPGNLKPKSLFEKSPDLPKRLFETVKSSITKRTIQNKNRHRCPPPPELLLEFLAPPCTSTDPLRRLLAQSSVTSRPATFADDTTIQEHFYGYRQFAKFQRSLNNIAASGWQKCKLNPTSTKNGPTFLFKRNSRSTRRFDTAARPLSFFGEKLASKTRV